MKTKLAIRLIAAVAIGLGTVDSDPAVVLIAGEGEATITGPASEVPVTASDEAVVTVVNSALPTGSIVFTDNFDDGKKPDWQVIWGAWADMGGLLQATALTEGIHPGRPTPLIRPTLTKVSGPAVLVGDYPADRTMIVVSDILLADCTIDVDSTPFIPSPEGKIIPWPKSGLPIWASTGSFNHAVLRYTDEKNYILAGYHPGDGGSLFIYEVIDNFYHQRAYKAKPHFYKAGPLHLTAMAAGPIITVRVTDCNGNTDSLSCEMTTLFQAGKVGLFHDDGAGGLPPSSMPPTSKYDNFVVRTPHRQRETHFGQCFARGVFFFNENDSLVSKTRIADPQAAQDYYARAMKDLAEHGFNLAIVYWTPVDHRKIMLDSAQQHGIKVVLHLPEIASMIRSSEQVNMHDYTERVTRGLRSHPAVAGYYIFDEPLVEPGKIVRAELARLALEVSDPEHPSLACIADVAGQYENVLSTLQLPTLLVDAYPLVNDWSGDFSEHVVQLQRAQRLAGDRPLWIAPQVFGKLNRWKNPTRAEIRVQIWLAIAHGAKGFMHFIYQSTTGAEGDAIQGLVDSNLDPIDGRLDELKRINADLARLSPTLLTLRPMDLRLPDVPDAVVARAFSGMPFTRYVVLANKDVKQKTRFIWNGVTATDVLTGKEVGSQIELAAGDGKLLQLQFE